MKKNNKNAESLKFRINDEIRGDYEVRIVGNKIESKVVSLSEAKKIAEDMELDLIEINANAKPPIMKIASYEKMIYELKKSAKKNKHATKPLKEIQLSVNISEHDLTTKANNARKFIEDGNKVKITVRFRGRELNYVKLGEVVLNRFIEDLSDVATPEKKPILEGKNMFIILAKKLEK